MAIQYISPIKLNLEKNRPNVLLFGNGFFHENMDWKSLLQRCAKDGIENNEFDELIKTDYLLFADAALDTSDSDRRKKYIGQISQSGLIIFFTEMSIFWVSAQAMQNLIFGGC